MEIEICLSSSGVEVGEVPSFFSLMEPFSSYEDSLSPLKLLNDDDDESSDSGFVVCFADCFDLKEGSDEPSPAEP